MNERGNAFSKEVRALLEEAGLKESTRETTGFEIYYADDNVILVHVQKDADRNKHREFLERYLQTVQGRFPHSEIIENVVSVWEKE